MEPVKLSWSEAEVNDGDLAVPLEGEIPKEWKQSFERTVALLHNSGDWGEITLKKHRVLVADVASGSEEKLKHHLESVLAQANTTLEDEASGQDGEAEPDGDADPGNDPDAEMTERFRSEG